MFATIGVHAHDRPTLVGTHEPLAGPVGQVLPELNASNCAYPSPCEWIAVARFGSATGKYARTSGVV